MQQVSGILRRMAFLLFVGLNLSLLGSSTSTDATYCQGHRCFKQNLNSYHDAWKPCHVCQSCACDDRCAEFGDCCSTRNATETQPMGPSYECVGIEIKDLSQEQHYFMVSTCLEGSDIEIKNKCLLPKEKPVKSWLPVKAKRSGSSWVTYRNQFCAFCNGVKSSEIHPWKIYIKCEQNPPFVIPRFESFEEIEYFVNEHDNCKFEYGVLPGIPERECETVPPHIMECNVTGDWDLYNGTIERLCHGKYMLFHANDLYYKNEHCYMCNSNDSRRLSQDVFECYMPSKGHGLLLVTLPGLPPLSMLINFNPIDHSEPGSKTAVKNPVPCNCSRGFVFDVYTETCRQLHCSSSLENPLEQCAPAFEYSKGLPFYARLILEPLHTIAIETMELNAAVAHLMRELQKKIELFPGVHILYIGYEFQFPINRNNTKTDSRTILRKLALDIYLVSQQITTYATFSKAFVSFVEPPWTLHLGDMSYTVKEKLDHHIKSGHVILAGESQNPVSYKIEELYAKGFNMDPLISYREHGPPATVYTNITTSKTRDVLTYARFVVLETGKPLKSVPSFDSFFSITSLWNCSTVQLNTSEYDRNHTVDTIILRQSRLVLQYGDFLRYTNGDIRVCAHLLTDNNPQRCLGNQSTKSDDDVNFYAQRIVTFVSLSVSIVCLMMTFVTYSLLKSLRTIPGQNNMCLSATIIVAQGLYLVQAFDIQNDVICKTVGILLHYLWLASFFWMNVCSFHVFIIFKNVWKSRSKRGFKRILVYFSYSHFVPLLIVGATVVSSYFLSKGTNIGYGEGTCYLSSYIAIGVTFALPLGIIIIMNTVFFIITVISMKDSPNLQKNKEHKRSSLMYVRLSTLTGVTWIIGFIATCTSFDPLWYIFTILCGGQGLFIFLSFIANRRVLEKYKQLYRRCRTGKKTGNNAYTCASKTGERRISAGNIFTLNTYSGLSSPTKDTVIRYDK